jgi:hypothetical protein
MSSYGVVHSGTGIAVLGMVGLFICFSVWPSLLSPFRPLLDRLPPRIQAEKPTAIRQPSPEADSILREKLYLYTTVQLLSGKPTRSAIQRKANATPGIEFVTTERKEDSISDFYSSPQKQNVLGVRYTYFLTPDVLVAVSYMLRPSTDAFAKRLKSLAQLSKPLEPAPSLPSRKVYLLGAYPVPGSQIVKVILTEYETGERDVTYELSDR